jgi:hypothetical protein
LIEHEVFRKNIAVEARFPHRAQGEKLDRAVSTDFRAVWQLKTCSMLCAQTITMVI